MASLTRRHLVGSVGALTAAATVRPRRAKAATTITAWFSQGFYHAEDQALKDLVAGWEKQTGNTVNLQIINTPDLISKTIAVTQIGDVPDVVHAAGGNNFLVPQLSWKGLLVDVSDVAETQKSEFLEAALGSTRYYDNVAKRRSYFAVPVKAATMMENSWRPLIEQAGFSDSDRPRTQDAHFEFFKRVHDKLRAKGKRVFGLGYSMATQGGDSNSLFSNFLVAYGGAGIVTPEGRLNIDDPAVRKAAVTTIERLTTAYKQGYVPPGAINWGDVDNNNAFFAKQIVMTPNYTISIPVAQMEKQNQYLKEIITDPLPLDNDGKPVPAILGITPAFIPKDAKNIDAAKDFLRYLIRPEVLSSYLKEARGRFTPVMPSMVKADPWWTDPSDPHRPVATRQGLVTPTMPAWQTYNPAYAQVISEQIWTQAEANVTQNGMKPEDAADEAIKRIKAIFERYEIA